MAVQYASRLALIAFAVSNLQGALSGTDVSGTIQSALTITAIFFVVGIIVGELGRRVTEESVEKELYKMFSGQTPTEEQVTTNK